MVEHNDDISCDIIDGIDPNSREYDKILDLLDFPLEILEADDNDWDARNSQDLGPIPSDAFMGFHQSNIENESVSKGPRRNCNTPINIESQQKEQVDCVVTYNNTVHRDDASTLRQNVISPETSALQTPSPISVLESTGTCSSGKSLLVRFEMVIPVRARSKRRRPSNVNPWFQKTPIVCAVAKKGSCSIQGKKVTSMQPSVRTRRCTHCQVTKTPQWREGPLGKNTLCNACGVRYRSGRLLPEYRPLASPTFTPMMHSNSHRKVIEMRKKAIQEPVVEAIPMSPLAEFIPKSS